MAKSITSVAPQVAPEWLAGTTLDVGLVIDHKYQHGQRLTP